jgi:hypothetical protein
MSLLNSTERDAGFARLGVGSGFFCGTAEIAGGAHVKRKARLIVVNTRCQNPAGHFNCMSVYPELKANQTSSVGSLQK